MRPSLPSVRRGTSRYAPGTPRCASLPSARTRATWRRWRTGSPADSTQETHACHDLNETVGRTSPESRKKFKDLAGGLPIKYGRSSACELRAGHPNPPAPVRLLLSWTGLRRAVRSLSEPAHRIRRGNSAGDQARARHQSGRRGSRGRVRSRTEPWTRLEAGTRSCAACPRPKARGCRGGMTKLAVEGRLDPDQPPHPQREHGPFVLEVPEFAPTPSGQRLCQGGHHGHGHCRRYRRGARPGLAGFPGGHGG
jgi:hypothetical protein